MARVAPAHRRTVQPSPRPLVRHWNPSIEILARAFVARGQREAVALDMAEFQIGQLHEAMKALPLSGLLDDGLGVTGGPDDGYRGIPRNG
jgi:hypothetical protein